MPNSSTSSGVISEPPPTPVKPTSAPIASPEREYKGLSVCKKSMMKSIPQTQWLFSGDRKRARRVQRAVEIGENVVDMLDADREADIAFRNAGFDLILRRKLRMGGRGGMNGEAARVADIGDVIEELQAVDETPPRFASFGEFETDKAAELAVQIFVGALARRAGLRRGMDNAHDLRSPGEPCGDRAGVGDMALDAQGERFNALQGEESVERRNRRAEIAQQNHARADDIGDRAKRLDRLDPDCAVIARIRRVEGGLALGEFLPVEIDALDDQTAAPTAMAAKIFGRGINDDRRAVIERTRDQRRRRIVDDQRYAKAAPDRGDLGDREHHQFRIGQRFGVIGAGAGVGGAAEILGVARVDETHFNALVLQRIGEQVPGAAVKIGRGNDIVAGARQILDRKSGSRLPR